MRRSRRTDEQESQDRWVVSYADFVTLLFAFFTAMYAISQVDAGKLVSFTGSMRHAFKAGRFVNPKPLIEGIVPVTPDTLRISRDFSEAIQDLQSNEDISVRTDARGVIVSVGDSILFDAGQSMVKSGAIPALTAIASVINRIPNKIVIEGHTDNVPLTKGPKYSSNWELSTARATSVLDYLLRNHNLSPERLAASGYAEFKPAATNSTPEGRGKNRRVDIVILSENRN